MPGTGLARDYSGVMKFAWHYIFPALRFVIANVNTPDASGNEPPSSGKKGVRQLFLCEKLARISIDPKFENVTGKYFEGDREIPSSVDSHSIEYAADLWSTSIELTHVTAQDALSAALL